MFSNAAGFISPIPLLRRSGRVRRMAVLLAGASLAFSPVIASPLPADDAIEQARELVMVDPARALEVARRLKASAAAVGVRKERFRIQSRAASAMVMAELYLRHPEVARRLSDEAYALGQQSGDLRAQADAAAVRGAAREEAGEPARALHDYLGSIELYRQIGHRRGQAVSFIYLGALYASAADTDRAERYFRQALEIYPDDARLRMIVHDSLGNLLAYADRFQPAIVEYDKAARLARQENVGGLEVHILGNIARTQARAGQVAASRISAGRALAVARTAGTTEGRELWLTMALVAERSGDVARALRYLEKALIGAGPLDTIRSEPFHLIAYSVYKKAGLMDRALLHLEKQRKLKEDATALAVSTKTALIAARFDYANQELRIAQLKASELHRDVADERAAKDRLALLSLIGGGAAFVTIGLLLVGVVTLRRGRERLTATNLALQDALSEVRTREKAEQEATMAAEHDSLTHLPNRRHMNQTLFPRASSSLGPGEQCVVLLIDLDRFKPINDHHGHDAGDAVLIEAAARMRKITAPYHAIPVRLGGDEFVVVMTCPQDSDLSSRLASHLIREISVPYQVGDLRLTLGASIGIARAGADGSTVDEVLRAADTALYEAKRSGRGAAKSFTADMDARLRERSRTEMALREAIAENAICAHFMPVVSFSTGEVESFEALARWEHADRGFISPAEFIPIAEDIGVIEEVTTAVLRQACRAARRWPDHIKVAINLSPVLLRDAWLTSKIFGILVAEGLPAGRLIIEVTENAVIDDIDAAREVLGSFRNAGILVAMDDFGKGYSSLSHLRDLSFDRMKLDAAFAQTISEPESFKIATAVASLARALDLPVTAEGVETAEAEAQLREMGFDHGQGYLFGMPMTADDAAAFVRVLPIERAA